MRQTTMPPKWALWCMFVGLVLLGATMVAVLHPPDPLSRLCTAIGYLGIGWLLGSSNSPATKD